MRKEIKELISEFQLKGYKTENLFERLNDLATNTDDAFLFATQFLKTFTKSATVFNEVLSYINAEQFKALINNALEIFKTNANENAETVIEFASLQFPELLHNDLELIFELNPNGKSFYANYPWRNLAKEKILFFKNKFENTIIIAEKEKLFECLLQTRDAETVVFAYNYAMETNLFKHKYGEDYLLAHLELVGFTIKNGNIENYCPNPVSHFVFSKNYFPKMDRAKNQQHPSWNLEPNETKYAFGGIIKEDDNNPLMHIITFNKIPSGIKISGLPQLVLGLHTRELNENGIVFYQHDTLGNPIKINDLLKIEDHNDLPMQQTEVAFTETPKRWEIQSWGSSNGNENLYRLGGEPTWIQNPHVIICPLCNEKMDFLMQLDTGLPDTNGGEVYFGSGGICYIFWCDTSKVSGYTMQCT